MLHYINLIPPSLNLFRIISYTGTLFSLAFRLCQPVRQAHESHACFNWNFLWCFREIPGEVGSGLSHKGCRNVFTVSSWLNDFWSNQKFSMIESKKDKFRIVICDYNETFSIHSIHIVKINVCRMTYELMNFQRHYSHLKSQISTPNNLNRKLEWKFPVWSLIPTKIVLFKFYPSLIQKQNSLFKLQKCIRSYRPFQPDCSLTSLRKIIRGKCPCYII